MNSNDKEIMQLALPAIATNITVPLLGLVDTTITGHMQDEAYVGAVSVGATLFNMIYWNFGFLRMGTSGQTAQAYGEKNAEGMANTLFRSLFFSAVFTLAIWLLQFPISQLSFQLMDTAPAIEANAKRYFNICIWGVPAILGMYSFKGWFIGMQNTRYPMLIAIGINVVNILASLFFVYQLGWEVEGIAYGTLLAQYVGLAMAITLWLTKYPQTLRNINTAKALAQQELKSFFKLNGSIFIRTICLISVMSFITFAGAHQGETIIAVNVILLQMFNLFSYFTDGFAYAGEALVGKYVGAKDRTGLKASIKQIFKWGWALVAVFTLVYVSAGNQIIGLLTIHASVREIATQYLFWAAIIPICGFSAFLWDGIMVGATCIKPMIMGTALGSLVFFALYALLGQFIGANHALWCAFTVYLATRGLVQNAKRSEIERKTNITA